MDRLDSILDMLDVALDTKRKRHITGGVLVSISLLFGGLALTVLTLKTEVRNETYIDARKDMLNHQVCRLKLPQAIKKCYFLPHRSIL